MEREAHANDADEAEGAGRQRIGDGLRMGWQIIGGCVVDKDDLIAARIQLPRKLVQSERGAAVQFITVAVIASVDDG